MACCAVLALLIGVVRGAWFRLLPHRRPAEPGFAPPAQRSADGSAPSVQLAALTPPAVRRPRLAGTFLLGVAYGTAAYALAIAVLGLTPLVRVLDGPWGWRDASLVLVGVAALVAGLALRPARSGAAVLLGLGAAWTELGLLDMHLLGLFEFRVAATPLDLLLHGSGPLLMVLAARRLAPHRPLTEASTA